MWKSQWDFYNDRNTSIIPLSLTTIKQCSILYSMEALLKRITEKKQQLETLRPLPTELSENLWDWCKVDLTYTSNAIEGNTLSLQETALVVEKGLTVQGKTIKEHLEALNHAEALEYIRKNLVCKKRHEVTEQDLLEIHCTLLTKIDDAHAGRYRSVPIRVAGSAVVFPNPVKVPELMKQLFQWLHSDLHEHPAKIAVDSHLKLVSIHPFVDGNGRTARLLINLLLMQEGYPPTIIRKESRLSYINSIEKAQLYGKSEDYDTLMYQSILESLDSYLSMASGKQPSEIIPKIAENKLLKIGALAKTTGETIHTLRYWTKEGLLEVKEQTAGGYQLYEPTMVKRVMLIRKLQQQKRFSIREIRRNISG